MRVICGKGGKLMKKKDCLHVGLFNIAFIERMLQR